MTKTTNYQTDIRPLFTERDIRGMSKAFNLGTRAATYAWTSTQMISFGLQSAFPTSHRVRL